MDPRKVGVCKASTAPGCAPHAPRYQPGPGTTETVYLLDLLRDVGDCKTIEARHPGEHIGQDAPVKLERDLPDYAAILLSTRKTLDLWMGKSMEPLVALIYLVRFINGAY